MNVSKRKKAIRAGAGGMCPKCKLVMQRFEHPEAWRPKANQPYFFKYWDICKGCRRIQMYEIAKVYCDEAA
jgi:hypothetical protein